MSRRRPTPEQERKLSKIVNRRQREALLGAIERGEGIPEFAWHPVPDLPEGVERELDQMLEPLVRFIFEMSRAGIDPWRVLSASPSLDRPGPVADDSVGNERSVGSGDRSPANFALRPDTYWPDEDDVRLRLSRIKGTVR